MTFVVYMDSTWVNSNRQPGKIDPDMTPSRKIVFGMYEFTYNAISGKPGRLYDMDVCKARN